MPDDALFNSMIQTSGQVASSMMSAAAAAEDRELRLKMYEDAKNYNSPVSQISRMLQAGLNPYSGNISADQIADSIDLGDNPMRSFADMFYGLSRSAQQYYSNRIAKENADTNLYNAETSRINAESNRMNAEVNQFLSRIRKDLMESQKQQYEDTHDLFDSTKDLRVSEQNLKAQITRFLRNKYSRENSWFSEHYDEVQDAILQGLLDKNLQTEFMFGTYYPAQLDLAKKHGDLDFAKYGLQYDLAHPFGVNSSSANLLEKFFTGLLRLLIH